MGETRYKKKHGGYQGWGGGGAPERNLFTRESKKIVVAAIGEIRAEGLMLYQGRFGENGFSDTNGVLVQVWRVDGCDWLISGTRLTSWAKIARARGYPSTFRATVEALGVDLSDVGADYRPENRPWKQTPRASRLRYQRQTDSRRMRGAVPPTDQTAQKLEAEERRFEAEKNKSKSKGVSS